MWLYHYTSQHCLASIVQSKTIIPSLTGKFGSGVYFSRLSPEDLPLEMVAETLFGVGGPASLRKGRLNCYIEVFVKNHEEAIAMCQNKMGSNVFYLREQVYRHRCGLCICVSVYLSVLPKFVYSVIG